MNATSIILLVGLVSFWGFIGLLVSYLLRFRRTLDSLEETLGRVRSDLAEITPRLSDTLLEMEKTGQEVGQTASELRVLTGRINSGTTPAVIGGAVTYLPAAVGVLKLLGPLFRKRKRGR